MSPGDLRVCLDAGDFNQFLELTVDRDMPLSLADSKATRALRDDRLWHACRDDVRHNLQFDIRTDVAAKHLKGASQRTCTVGDA
ncbi:MAG: hypothetical protein OXN89_00930 [Bryobacterales bacterium]|nr:hypothetical protein [Bryobacterales bacterium]